MIIHGGRQWTDYRVETRLTVHLAEHAGIGVRVQGLRRYYAVLLTRPGLVRLVRAFDGVVTILAATPLELSFEKLCDVVVQVLGREIEARVGGVALKARDESPFALDNGGVALIVRGGACSCDAVVVAPPHSVPAVSDKARSSGLAA